MAMLDWCNLHQREDECEWRKLYPDAHKCPARKWESCCPYPSVCRDKETCVDGTLHALNDPHISHEALSYGVKCAECNQYETACKCPSK